jgi:type IV pilus assembly protein PilY1
MNKKFTVAGNIVVVSMSIMLSAGNVYADDTDIFVNSQTNVNSRPNIVFITDNSGSMRTKDVTAKVDPYDGSKSYSGSYSTSRWYYGHSAQTGDARSGSPLDNNISYCKGLEDQVKETGKYEGDLIGLLAFTGSFSRYGRYSGWWDLSIGRNYGNDYRAIECISDYGKHGQTDGATKKYPTRARGTSIASLGNAWTSKQNKAFNYASRSTYGGVYSGNYLNYLEQTSSAPISRMEAVKGVLDDLISSMNNVNFGLMSFNKNDYTEGGIVNYPVVDVDTKRTELRNEVAKYNPDTWTPLGETLFEAARYFSGDEYYFGKDSHSNALNNKKYKSPIGNECQANAVIFLTDGEPSKDTNHISTIENYIGKQCKDGNCLDEVATYMANNDMRPDIAGEQTVRTYTVGFKADFPLLQQAATNGRGQYFTVQDTEGLTTSIKSIVNAISQEGTTFTAPGVSVNFFGSLENNNEIYYSLFQPEGTERWPGNLKRYQLGFDANGQVEIQDAKNAPAVDPNTGRLVDSAQSFWSDIKDGADVSLGGASSQQELPRNLYTFLGSNPSNELLTSTANKLSKSNGAITRSMLGAATDSERDDILLFAQGYDIKDENNNGDKTDLIARSGDPLHSQPVVVQYKPSGTESTIIYYGTNEGYIHAVDAEDGDEVFAFMPKELLKNLKRYKDDASLTGSKPYGMDGEILVWVNDLNGNGYLRNSAGSLDSGEKAYLFSGMRRGGSNYYALDVTDPSSPKIAWQIEPTGDFSELGQTWSKPQLAKVRYQGKDKAALIFTGGYDDFQDGQSTRTADSKGRAIYVVDALTGKRLWAAGNGSGFDLKLPDMLNSMAAAPVIMDSNGDRYIDTIVAADTAGRVWRFAINEIATDIAKSGFATGGMIADLADASTSGNRRFFTTPDILLDRKTGGKESLLIALGSGRRASPLDKVVDDRFYVLRSLPGIGPKKDPLTKQIISYDVIKSADLFNATAENSLKTAISGNNTTAIKNYSEHGFYTDLLKQGEKVLGDALIFGGYVLFNTYTPNTTISQCGSNLGTNKLYAIKLFDPDKRSTVDVKQTGIAARPTTTTIRDPATGLTKTTVTVGTEVIELDDITVLKDRSALIKMWVEENQ